MTTVHEYSLTHLDRMCDERGIFEHADGANRREHHGYCTDDNARLLIAMSREAEDDEAHELGRRSLAFVLDSIDPRGRVRNRLSPAGRWTDAPTTEDCWGRAVWALGTAAAVHPDARVRASARAGFESAARQDCSSPRSLAFAALGAAEVLAEDSEYGVGSRDALRLLEQAATRLVPPAGALWIEPRLTYANAAVAEAAIAAGAALGSAAVLRRGLDMLSWLVDIQQRDGHLSVVGTQGREVGVPCAPQFDQQPIEVAALADAAWRSWVVTGERAWVDVVEMAAAWFRGGNDVGAVMVDAATGGGYDGLTPNGPNLNQGAESTLAFVTTMQRAASLERIGSVVAHA